MGRQLGSKPCRAQRAQLEGGVLFLVAAAPSTKREAIVTASACEKQGSGGNWQRT